MKKTLFVTVGAACLLATSSLQAALNLVQDPGFEGGETGTLTQTSTPWSNPSPVSANVVINGSHPFAGSFNAVLTSQTGESAVLNQATSLPFQSQYTVNFWISTPGSGGTLTVDLNGVFVANGLVVAGETVYTQYTFLVNSAPQSGVLSFIWSSTAFPASLDIDNVSIDAVPEPTTMVAGALMLLPFAASTFRLRKKASA
jgi:hypothetical protein